VLTGNRASNTVVACGGLDQLVDCRAWLGRAAGRVLLVPLLSVALLLAGTVGALGDLVDRTVTSIDEPIGSFAYPASDTDVPIGLLPDPTVNTVVPISGTTTNPCNGEDVTFTGTLHMVFHFHVDNSGGMHLDSLENTSNVKGVGMVTIVKYVISQTDNMTLNLDPASETTTALHENEISQTRVVPDFKLHFIFHITLNANGTVTAVVFKPSATCT
jgi:hypothetical protein